MSCSYDELKRRLEARARYSNEFLSDQEQSIVRELLSNALLGLHRLELEPNLSEPVNEKREIALKQVEKFRIAIAPHKNLPSEILTEIFRLSLPAATVNFPPDLTSAPWSLERVCSRWRRLVLTESHLWRHVQISYQHAPRLRNRVNVLAYRKIYSRGLVSLVAGISHKDNMTFTNFIMSHSSTLEDLSLSLYAIPPAPFLSLRPGNFKSLQRLKLRFPPRNLPHSPPISVFSHTPNLREVEIICLSNTRFDFRISLPWAQITDLVIDCRGMDSPQLCSLLRSCTALVNGIFHLIMEISIPLSTTPVVVPALQTITLHTDYGSRATNHLLRALTLPALISFAILGRGQRGWPHSEFSSFITRSSCQLQSFETEFGDVNFESLLPTVPNLRELKLPLTSAVPTTVIKSMIDQSLVPQLEVLHFGAESLNVALDLMVDRWSVDPSGGMSGIWEAVIGYTGNVQDRNEGLVRYEISEKPNFWKEERKIELRFVK